MNELSLSNINKHSPYKVEKPDGDEFVFQTDKGIIYGIIETQNAMITNKKHSIEASCTAIKTSKEDDDFIEGDDELMDIEESYKIIEKAIDDIYDER